jgi:hypothetical protein
MKIEPHPAHSPDSPGSLVPLFSPACWRSTAPAGPSSGSTAAGPRTSAWRRCSASFPHAFPAVLRVTTRTGEELEACAEVNRGSPGNPCPTRIWRGSSTTTP